MDARPIFERYEMPALNTTKIKSDKMFSIWAFSTLKNSIKDGLLKILEIFMKA